MATIAKTVTASAMITLNRSGSEATTIHGTAILGDYVYGSSRDPLLSYRYGVYGASAIFKNRLIRIHKDNYSTYDAIQIADTSITGSGVSTTMSMWNMDGMAAANGYIYTAGQMFFGYATQSDGVAKIDASTLDYLLVDTVPSPPKDGNNYTQYGNINTLCSDGQYVWGGNFLTAVWKLNCSDLSYVARSDYGAHTWNYAHDPQQLSSIFHACTVDDNYIFMQEQPISNTASLNRGGVHKINKNTMAWVIGAVIPQGTDDMDQDDLWLYDGPEVQSTASWGANVGAIAVRKSDMQPFFLPKLDSYDLFEDPSNVDANGHKMPTAAYSSLVFGDYLVIQKTNGRIYVLDKTHPETWTTGSDPNDFVLYSYLITDPSGGALPGVTNELLLDSDQNFHASTWTLSFSDPSHGYNTNPASFIKFSLNDLSFVGTPRVLTNAATGISATSATMNGSIVSLNGAPAIAQSGFHWGTNSSSFSNTVYTGTTLGAQSYTLSSLSASTQYYFQFFASSIYGASSGSIQSMKTTDLVPSIQGTVQLSGSVIQGAKVTLIDSIANAYQGKTTTDINGVYSFSGLNASKYYHVIVEYDNGTNKYNSISYPYVKPVGM